VLYKPVYRLSGFLEYKTGLYFRQPLLLPVTIRLQNLFDQSLAGQKEVASMVTSLLLIPVPPVNRITWAWRSSMASVMVWLMIAASSGITT
jgi:hypothetical protein